MRHIVIGGGSGFIGTALATACRARGDRVTLISRFPGDSRITWDDVARSGLPVCDAVINLAGKHILDLRRRWTPAYREEVISSRVGTTETLVAAMNAMPDPPAVFVSTAGKCFYGTGEIGQTQEYRELDEDSEPMGLDFPAELVSQWERAAGSVDTKRIRHVRLRIGIVLGAIERRSRLARLWRVGRTRGILPLMRLPFCLGIGATIGHGRQPFPWVHIDDVTAILIHLLDNPELNGSFNAVAPGIVNNRDFTAALARRVRRPIVWTMPVWFVKRIVGAERASILLEGQNVKPKRTLESGYEFRFPDLDSALGDLVQITV